MKNKKLLHIAIILAVVLVGLLIVSPWGWFCLKGFSATNAPMALIGIMGEDSEVLNSLINKNIIMGYSETNLPTANAVWNLGNYSEHWFYMDPDPKNSNTYFTKVKIGCRNGKVILANVMHGVDNLEWAVVFFESDAKGLKDAWEKNYGNKSG
jgi:hypothetical protein